MEEVRQITNAEGNWLSYTEWQNEIAGSFPELAIQERGNGREEVTAGNGLMDQLEFSNRMVYDGTESPSELLDRLNDEYYSSRRNMTMFTGSRGMEIIRETLNTTFLGEIESSFPGDIEFEEVPQGDIELW